MTDGNFRISRNEEYPLSTMNATPPDNRLFSPYLLP